MANSAGDPRVDMSRDTLLIDEPLAFAVSSCEPGRTVEVPATITPQATARSSAVLIERDDGTVDITREASEGGGYFGVDPFGLWWAGETTAVPSYMYATYTYVTYVASSPARVWEALTDSDLTAQYGGHSNISDWQVGSRLTMTFDSPGDSQPAEGPTKVIFEIEPYHEIVRLTVMHENLADSDALDAVSAGWPAACANLKSLLETSHVLPRAP